MDDLQGRNINQDDIAHLTSQGVLHLPDEEKDKNVKLNAEIEVELANKNQSLLNYTYEEYLSHENFGDIFSINFISFKPTKNIDSLNNIPNKIYFKFSFWDFEEIITEQAIITKPSELKSSYLSSPPSFFIYKAKNENERIQTEKEMKIKITFDPSIDNYIDYKHFLNYLLLRELFIQVFDYDKQLPYGYFKIPLRHFVRYKKKSNFENFSVNIYDNFNYEQKGTIELVLKSDEIKTVKPFNLEGQQEKFTYFYSTNQFINSKGYEIKHNPHIPSDENHRTKTKRKKVVCVAPMNYNKLAQIEKDLYAQKILEFKNKNNITGTVNDINSGTLFQNSTMNNMGAGSTFLDQNLEKRIRVLRFLDTYKDDGKKITMNDNMNNNITYLSDDLMQSKTLKNTGERNFYETLNYSNYIKNLNKETIIERAIAENNKNILTIALIQGEPHYFNFILTNESNHEELYHIIISKNEDKESIQKAENENQHPFYSLNDESKNDKSINFKDNIVKLVTNSKEYEYITILNGLKIPNEQNYNCVSNDGHVVLEKHHSVPLLFKCLSFKCLNGYDDNCQSKYSIFIYNQNNIPQYFLNVNIIKVFPVVDFEFRFNVEEKKLSQIKFFNPFKYNTPKSQNLLKTHHFINSIDKNSDINIKLDPLTNDFFFNFNNLTNLADNQINLNSVEANSLYQNNNIDLSLNNNKRLLFLYKDIYKGQLLSTFKFLINAYDCIDICSDLGVKKKYKLFLPIIDTPKTIKIYSSNEDVLFLQGIYNEKIIMVPNMRLEIEYIVFSKKVENHEILINCVDISNKEVIKTWLVKTSVNQPKVSQVIKVDCMVGSSTQVKFSFTSPLNTWAVLHFESSNRRMIQLPSDQIAFNSEENKIITINVCKYEQAGRGTAYVFISDNDNLFNQTIQVDVSYY